MIFSAPPLNLMQFTTNAQVQHTIPSISPIRRLALPLMGSRLNAVVLAMFAQQRKVEEEMKVVDQMRRENPDAAKELMENGRMMVELARKGDLAQFVNIATNARPGDFLHWFCVKMFVAACEGNELHVMRYMIENGMDPKTNELQETLHTLINKHGAKPAAPLANTLSYLCTYWDINYQRPSDYWTALHVACANNNIEVAALLVAMGGDVNAVGEEDAMPLTVTESNADRNEKLVEFLLGKGAKRTWRRGTKPTPKVDAMGPMGPEIKPTHETASEMNTLPSEIESESPSAQAASSSESIFKVETDGGFTFGT